MKGISGHILVIEDDAAMAGFVEAALTEAGWRVTLAGDVATARQALDAGRPDQILTDMMLPDGDGLEILQQARDRYPHIPVVIMTAFGTVPKAVAAIQGGADNYLLKPFPAGELLRALDQTSALAGMAGAPEPMVLPGLIGVSGPMRELARTVQKVAPSTASVLIQGESGVGKELVARALHELSPRRERPFIAVVCSALPGTLLESELFGHTQGAFSGATQDRVGLIAQCNGGTLFLDEVAEMDLDMQTKLLRVLQEREVRPIGSSVTQRVDVRFVSATNRRLEQALAAGELREDLFYRLNVVTLDVPPLRERPSDIPPIVMHLLGRIAQQRGREAPTLSAAALDRLCAYDWPGNVRELGNVIEQAVLLCDGPVIRPADLEPAFRHGSRAQGGAEGPGAIPTLEEVEKSFILRALKETSGNKVRAAALLGIDRKTISRKLKAYKLDAEDD